MAGEHDLPGLLRAVVEARRTVDDARRKRVSSHGGPVAAVEQRELWSVLEDYAAELERRGQPLPYRMRNEVTMYRLIFRASDPDMR